MDVNADLVFKDPAQDEKTGRKKQRKRERKEEIIKIETEGLE